jgi:hypothetical protein
LGQLVVHRPAGDDDAAHADLDQLGRDARGELVAVAHRRVARCGVNLPEVAAAQVDEFGHRLHRGDFGGGDQQAVGQHDAAAAPAVAVQQIEHAVRRDVQQPVRLAVERCEHLAGRDVGADRLRHAVVQSAEDGGNRVRLGLGAGQRRRVGVVGSVRLPRVGESGAEALDRRVADDECAALQRLLHLGAKAVRCELTHDGSAHRHRPHVVGRAGGVGQHQLPRQVGGCGIDDEHDAFELARGVLELVRHHQLEQHAADVLLPHGVVDLLAHERLDQPGLTLLDDRFGARPLADVQEAQPCGDRGTRCVRRARRRGGNRRRIGGGSAVAIGVRHQQTRPVAWPPASNRRQPPPGFSPALATSSVPIRRGVAEFTASGVA